MPSCEPPWIGLESCEPANEGEDAMPEKIKIESREQWLTLRHQDVTSTEVAALYGLHPRMTEYELGCRKSGPMEPEEPPREEMELGLLHEPTVALVAGRRLGVNLVRSDVYMQIPEIRIGSSFDYFFQDGETIVEIKTTSERYFRSDWRLLHGGDFEAPIYIEIQAQTQMAVSGIRKLIIAVMVGGQKIYLSRRVLDDEVARNIMEYVTRFWANIASGTLPPPDYRRDGDFIAARMREVNAGETIVADAALVNKVAAFVAIRAQSAECEKNMAALRAEIIDTAKTASKIVVPSGVLYCGKTSPSKGTTVTQEMVGTVIGARGGGRILRYSPTIEEE